MGLALIAGWKEGLALPLLFFLVRMSGYLGKGWREVVMAVVVEVIVVHGGVSGSGSVMTL